MISSPRLERKGYVLEIHSSLDAPFVYVFSLCKTTEHEIARINFNLFLSKNNIPSLIIGNMQGRRKKDIQEFKLALNVSPLDYMVARMRKAFTARHSLALNPKRFQYYRVLSDRLVATGMFNHQTMTGKELNDYMDFLRILNKNFARDQSEFTPDMLAARNKVLAGKERIKREGIGMHTAAFHKAGFKRGKRKYWKHQRVLK